MVLGRVSHLAAGSLVGGLRDDWKRTERERQ